MKGKLETIQSKGLTTLVVRSGARRGLDIFSFSGRLTESKLFASDRAPSVVDLEV